MKKKIIIATTVLVLGTGIVIGNQFVGDNPVEPTKIVTVEPTATNTQDTSPNPTSAPDLTKTMIPIKATEHTTPAASTDPDVPTVVSYRKIVIDENTVDCEYTYSDKTTKQFHWQVTNPQGAWQDDGMGGNGHYTSTTQTTGVCDDSIIGTPKY